MMIYLYTSSLIPMLLFRNALSFLSIQLNKLNMLDPPLKGQRARRHATPKANLDEKRKFACMYMPPLPLPPRSTQTRKSQSTNRIVISTTCHRRAETATPLRTISLQNTQTEEWQKNTQSKVQIQASRPSHKKKGATGTS